MLKSLFRFGSVGGISFAINIGLTAFLHELLGIVEEIAFSIALAVAFTFNFVGCKYYVFSENTGDSRKQLIAYFFSSLLFRGIEYLGFILLHTLMGVQYLAAVFLVLVFSFFAKFTFYKKVVFS
jgi:putative flippase GtrA